jgi:hypothetical protein
MVMPASSSPRRSRAWGVLRGAGTVVLYALMLLAVLAMWKTNAPPFIYVAF